MLSGVTARYCGKPPVTVTSAIVWLSSGLLIVMPGLAGSGTMGRLSNTATWLVMRWVTKLKPLVSGSWTVLLLRMSLPELPTSRMTKIWALPTATVFGTVNCNSVSLITVACAWMSLPPTTTGLPMESTVSAPPTWKKHEHRPKPNQSSCRSAQLRLARYGQIDAYRRNFRFDMPNRR